LRVYISFFAEFNIERTLIPVLTNVVVCGAGASLSFYNLFSLVFETGGFRNECILFDHDFLAR